jgi:hypothetical protein
MLRMNRLPYTVVPAALFAVGGCGGTMDAQGRAGVARSGTDLLPTDPTALTNITIDCGDGYPTVATVDNDTLAAVQNSIQSMLDNPADMVCTLSTSPVTTTTGLLTTNTRSGEASSSGNATPFFTGGGRYPAEGCELNFAISGHMEKDGSWHGTQTITVPSGNQPSGCGLQGSHIKADVSCGSAVGKNANGQGRVMESSGPLAQFFPPGEPLTTIMTDNGNPSSGTPDLILQTNSQGFPLFTGPCMSAQNLPGTNPIDNGNITVHPTN